MVLRLNILTIVLLLVIAPLAVSDDAPYLRLSRIAYLEGDVSSQRLPDVDWSAASINMPLEPGDRIYTGRNGRVEIEFDDNSVLRLAENTDIEILSLDEKIVQIRMLLGLATLVVASDADFEVNTPAAAFNAVKKGNYRFEVNEDGDTDAIVRKGKIEAGNNAFERSIDSGTRLRVRVVDDGNHAVARYNARDAWDEWNDRRSVERRAYESRRYLPADVSMGVADLDRYGRWVHISNYGSAWVPYSVDVHWSPYSVGRWCYRPRFGWTWISYEPWGWLPYHYGRWHQSAGFGWCWIPGPGFSFNFWSPGLVAFYSGPTWVSWVPLGPRDHYNIQHYHYNRGIYSHQLDKLRTLHTRAPGDHYNRNARGAFRTVHVDHFRNGSFNERSASTRWGNIERPWREGTLVRERLDIRPTRASYHPAPHRTLPPPRELRERPVVVRHNPRGDDNDRSRYRTVSRTDDRERMAEGSSPSMPGVRRAERDTSAAEGSTRGAISGRGDHTRIGRNLQGTDNRAAPLNNTSRWRTATPSLPTAGRGGERPAIRPGRDDSSDEPSGQDTTRSRNAGRIIRTPDPSGEGAGSSRTRTERQPESERNTPRWRIEGRTLNTPQSRMESPVARPERNVAPERQTRSVSRTTTQPSRDAGRAIQTRRTERAPSTGSSGSSGSGKSIGRWGSGRGTGRR